MARTTLAVLFLVFGIGQAVAQLELQVNTYTTHEQFQPAVGRDAAGNFVVVWNSFGQDGSQDGIFAQRFDNSGAALGSEFQVNTYTTSGQYRPSVGVDGAGNFVVVWDSFTQDGSFLGVFAQRYDSNGMTLGSEFQVNTHTTLFQAYPDVAVDGAGNFVVAWNLFDPYGLDPDSLGIVGQRFDSNGMTLGSEFLVNTYTTGIQNVPAIAADGSGNFVVVWESAGQDGFNEGIFARRYDSSGVALGSEFQVNSYTTYAQVRPDVAMDGLGNFIVTWTSVGQDGPGASTGVFAQRYDSSGAALGAEFQVNTYTTFSQSKPAVAADAAGNFLVTWEGSWPSDDVGVFGQRYTSTGARLGPEFRLNTYTTDTQDDPAVAVDAAGNFVVVWKSSGQDGNLAGVFAKRLGAGLPILGKKLLVKDPDGTETRRNVVVIGKESASDIGSIAGEDPLTNGATLRVITNGTVDSDQTFVLDASGWRVSGSGFRYTGPTGGDDDPVRTVIFRRAPSGQALLKAILRGTVGTQSVDVVPPNAGDDGGVILTINNGGTYCTLLGGAASGVESQDTAQQWKVLNATLQPGCPAP